MSSLTLRRHSTAKKPLQNVVESIPVQLYHHTKIEVGLGW